MANPVAKFGRVVLDAMTAAFRKREYAPGGIPPVPQIRDQGARPDQDPDRDAEGRFKTPPMRAVTEPPAVVATDFVDVNQIKAAIQAHDEGNFRSSALLWDIMLRDDRLQGVLRTRTTGLLGLPMSWSPAGEVLVDGSAPKDKKAIEVSEEVQQNFHRFMSSEVAEELLTWGMGLGVGLASLDIKVEDNPRRWTPQVRVWHPQFIYWRWDTRSFWVSTTQGPEEVRHGDGRWILYAPYGDQRGWKRGLVRSICLPFAVRQWCRRDWARYSEAHGSPVRKAIVPSGGDKKQKDRFVKDVAALANDVAIRCERDENDHGYDVTLLEAGANTWEGFDKLMMKCDSDLSIAIVGQNLTNEAGTRGTRGSLATANVHERVRGDILQADDRTFNMAVYKGMLQRWAEWNHGDCKLAPLGKFATEPAEDLQIVADSFKSLSEVLLNLRKAGKGISDAIDARKLLVRFKIPLKEGTPDVIDLGVEEPKEVAPKTPSK